MPPRTHTVLIDFESIQPQTLAALDRANCRVMVFVGATQAKIPFEVASSMQRMGTKAEYVKISGTGPNALDFHIAFYIGQLAAAEPNACFYIISKDTGFDPLIQHLKSRKIPGCRFKDICELPFVNMVSARTPAERLAVVVAKLRQLEVNRPRTVKTLSSTINSLFQKCLAEEEVGSLVDALVESGIVSLAEGKVIYAPAATDLPEAP